MSFSGVSGRSNGVGVWADELSHRRRAAVLATCCLTVLITGMDLLFALVLGLAIAALGVISTSPRAMRSAERLAPLIAPAQATR